MREQIITRINESIIIFRYSFSIILINVHQNQHNHRGDTFENG